MGFKDDLAAAKAAEPETVDVSIALNGTPYTVRIRAVDGLTWTNVTDRAPIRLDVALDRQFGYNLRDVVQTVLPIAATLLDADGVEVPVVVDQSDPDAPVDEWADLVSALDGKAFSDLSDAVFQLNVKGPYERVDAAKKALTASRKSSRSRSK